MNSVYKQAIYIISKCFLPMTYFKILNISLISSLKMVKDHKIKLNHYSIGDSVDDLPSEILLSGMLPTSLTPDSSRTILQQMFIECHALF